MQQFSTHSHRQIFLAIIVSGLLLLSAACSHERTDAQIIGDVVTRIHANPQIANKNIAVMSASGVVTLNGTAASDAERVAVANAAAQVEGVKTVINDLVIDGPVSLPQMAELPQAPAPEVVRPVVAPPAQERNKPSSYRRSQSANTQASNARTANTVSNAKTSSSAPAQSTQTPAGAQTVSVIPPSSSPASSVTPTPAKSDAVLIPYPPAPVKMVTVESGTGLSVRLVDSLDTARNKVGDTFRATLEEPISVDDRVVIPAGSEVVGKISQVKDSGRFEGRAELAIELTSLRMGSQHYELHTNQFTQQGSSQGARTAKTVGGGAALGALIGAIAGGGKGAAIGAAAGAGAGGGVQAARGAQQVRLGSEAKLHFRLENSLFVPSSSSPQRTRTYEADSTYGNSTASQPRSNRDYHDNYPSSDNSPNSSDGDRPVLKRRPPPVSDTGSDGPN